MDEAAKAAKVLKRLKAAQCEPAHAALPLLNELVGLVQGGQEQPLEVEEARSSAFSAICEVGKALHRKQPAANLWVTAIAATEWWQRVAK
jgi:hypothetical protein